MYATVTLETSLVDAPMFAEVRARTRSGSTGGGRIVRTAVEQKVCPVTHAGLGTMGEPVPIEIKGRKVWTCCDACPAKVAASPDKYLAVLSQADERDGVLAVATEGKCPVTGSRLGSMGTPVAVEVKGHTILTCCGACPPKIKAAPDKYLARLAAPPKDSVLTIPESAVIDTGSRKVVYVESEPGVYEGRVVVLGPRSGDRFPVLEGLAVGDKVAAAGAFLIDAESRLNPATRGEHAGPSPAPPAPAPPVSHQHGA
jgi:hypothetical protein